MNKMKLQLIAAALMALATSASGISEYSQGAKLSKDIIYSKCTFYCFCPNNDKDCWCDLWGCALRPDKAQQTG